MSQNKPTPADKQAYRGYQKVALLGLCFLLGTLVAILLVEHFYRVNTLIWGITVLAGVASAGVSATGILGMYHISDKYPNTPHIAFLR